MGTFLFRWEHPAEEVYVTGTFDNWSQSEKLVKTKNAFEKNVTLSSAADKIYYKFVVDGRWVTDHTAPQENDASGNLNNVLTIDRIVRHNAALAPTMSGVAPNSTTAALAGDVPLEKGHTGSSDLPGAFPETPAAVDKGDFSVNPLPAADGSVNPIKLAPGEKVPDPNSFTNNTVSSGVHDDPELVAAAEAAKKDGNDQTYGVAPLPAFAGGVNPVKVAPGKALPNASTLTGNTIQSGIRTDKETYDNSGGLGAAPALPTVDTTQNERDSKGTGIPDLPPSTNKLIPESGLPVGAAAVGTFNASPTMQSAGPQSTTSQLAANVPRESSKVPEVVKHSQREAGVDPEASAIPEEVKEKSAVEKELLSEVPAAPSTSEGTAGKGTEKSEKGVTASGAAAAVGGAAVALGGAAAAYASGLANKLPQSVTGKLPISVQNSLGSTAPTEPAPTTQPTAQETPKIVQESIANSGQDSKAAGNKDAVFEKSTTEKELLPEVKTQPAAGKKLSQGGLDAPASSATEGQRIESRDVSPGTVPGAHGQNIPTITSGVRSTATDETSSAKPLKDTASPATPVQATPGNNKAADSPSNSSAADKKNKRRSFFGKLKARFSDKDKN